MRKVWKLVGIATLVAVLGVAAVGAVAFAQDEEGTGFDFHQRFREAVAEILGVTVDEYDAALEQAQGQVLDEALAEGWLTEEQAELLRWRMEQAPGPGRMDLGKAMHGFARGIGRPGDNLASIAAEVLDMSLTDLLTALQDGQSIAEIAGEQGVDTQEIVDAYLAEISEDLEEAVAEGDMTQTQADYYLQRAEERALDQLENTWEGGPRAPGGHMGGPGLGGF
jgi:polyhydroxyalkanoate synthesis regulator phasin